MLATLTGSSRLILVVLGNPGRFLQVYPGWAGHPDGFLQVNPGCAGHPDGFLQVNNSIPLGGGEEYFHVGTKSIHFGDADGDAHP